MWDSFSFIPWLVGSEVRGDPHLSPGDPRPPHQLDMCWWGTVGTVQGETVRNLLTGSLAGWLSSDILQYRPQSIVHGPYTIQSMAAALCKSIKNIFYSKLTFSNRVRCGEVS